jgi:3alpha(or 20beta)-hydroxysteroid dehydrogenase
MPGTTRRGRLAGKVALISGAARGQGAAEARLFAAEGAAVVLGDVLDAEGAAVAAEIGGAAAYVHLDVTREDAWRDAIGRACSRFGRLDVLVNNAGIVRPGPLETLPLEDFEAVVRVNQIGCFLGMKTAIPALRAAGGGSIVNISSIAGLRGRAGVIAYAASKWAIRGMTKSAALELGGFGIRVNSVHPGAIDTPMISGPDFDPAARAAHVAKLPIARMGEPADVAPLVLFLASDESAYCTGADFVVDGGATAS